MSGSVESPVSPPGRFDSDDMAARGRIGAFARLAKHDARELTAPARAAFLDKFEREVDPDGTLTDEERQRRATYARKAHFAKLSRLSSKARRAQSVSESGGGS